MDPFKNRQNMETLLQLLNEGIQMVDAQGVIVYCNEAAATLDSLHKEQVVGHHILEIYPSLTAESSTLLQVLKVGEPICDYQQTFLNYQGSKITTINTTIPILEQGVIVGALEISRDITRVRELSEQLVDLQKKMYGTQRQSARQSTRQSKGTAKYTFDHVVGQSAVLARLKQKAMKAAMTQSSVIVYGSTGTGKELIVQAIHNASQRRENPFVAQNCAAIPATLLESILFGTVKGSFTGADHRPGLFELANKGTLFLDEINSMPMELQAKLLRVLEEKSIRRVGDIRTRDVDVRIIAAMNVDPFEAVQSKMLREDLFYRLNVVSLRLPDLKERQEDFPRLLEHFIEKFNERLGKHVRGITPEAYRMLEQHDWPGNVRELENIIEGTLNVMEGDAIEADDLPPYLQRRRPQASKAAGVVMVEGETLKGAMNRLEKQFILTTYHQTGENITRTARLLGLPRQTLQYRLGKLGIKTP
ncbi:sigma-54 interaction domain-containing protein [Anoxynatronum sibiricum]|uniref:Sigma 54-interacting transcriptional regulator n=1 Tax=Anoxynatronum sibiricum TaxID=210623 RepID=A0ABU9VUS6_9CLOT